MPFQVSLCSSIAPSKITIVMSSDVTSPCMVTLNLIATVVVGNANDHTFLWEQAAGTQVVFNTPVDQLTANCTLLDSTDKTFYFWVDKGTANETRFIFNYRGTATETTPMYASHSAVTGDQKYNTAIPAATIIGTQELFSSPTNSTSTINPNNLVLKWQLPSDVTGLVNVSVEQNIGGVWTTVLSIGATANQQLNNPQQNTYYRVKTTYLLDRQHYSQYSSAYYVQIDPSNYNAYVDDTLLLPSNTITITYVGYYTLLNIDSITNEIVDVVSPGGSNSFGAIYTTLYTLLNMDNVTNEIVDIVYPGGSNSSMISTVGYFGGTAIGG